MNRPYIVIHTHTSIDGNINFIDAPGFKAGSQHYKDIAFTPGKQRLDIDAYLNGTTSTRDNVTGDKQPEVDGNAAPVPAGDFIAEPEAGMYYVSIDPRGELALENSSFGYGGVRAHFIEVLTDAAGNAFKDYLRRRGISYIIAGSDQIDYAVMLGKLHALGIQRLMVAGGGSINWSFVQNGLVDEVSMVLSPIADGDSTAPRFFTACAPYTEVRPTAFRLLGVEDLGEGVVWLRYAPRTDAA